MRAALSNPDEQTEEITRAALSADDAAQRTDKDQTAARYVFEAYDLDPREFIREVGDSDEDTEYALRDELASREKNPEPVETDEASDALAALSIGDRATLDSLDVPADDYVRSEYGVDPSSFDREELREIIRRNGGYSYDRSKPSNLSSFSDPRRN